MKFVAILVVVLAVQGLGPGGSTLTEAMASRLAIRASNSFQDSSCKGEVSVEGFSKLNKICNDCYDLYKSPDIYKFCK